MYENLITSEELTQYAPDLDLSLYSETTISGMISRASQRVIGFCQVDGFARLAVTNEMDRAWVNTSGELIIAPRRPRVASGDITRIALRTVDVNQSLTLESNGLPNYLIPTPGNLIVYPSTFFISHGDGLYAYRGADLMYEMDYTGGFETIPPDVKDATTLYVRDQLAVQQNPAGVKSFTQGSYSVSFDSKGESNLVKQAKDILSTSGYVRRVFR